MKSEGLHGMKATQLLGLAKKNMQLDPNIVEMYMCLDHS